ncbi:50S ribosomal protein L22 [Candidatus Micrarchaeota archaeon]|nr:50S ribosomal protein L22 [Candidatus Micrarchaeota archaeon]
MGLYKYSMDFPKEKCARAQCIDLNASYKDLANVCSAIKGKAVGEARAILEDAIKGKKAIPYKKFSKGVGHRSELGGKKGRYPKKECRLMLELLKSAESNAEYKGLDKGKLVVKHVAAFKQNVYPRYRRFWAGGNILGYGKSAVRSDFVTARVEIALVESDKVVMKKEKKKERKQAGAARHGVGKENKIERDEQKQVQSEQATPPTANAP